MSTLGKVLTFINVLFAVVFLVVAGMDYGKQQSWSYSEFRHRIAVSGLPVNYDDIDDSEPNKDYPIAERLTPGVIKDIFTGNEANDDPYGLGGPGVKTLFEEVDRVKAKVNGNVTGAKPEDQKPLLRIYLVGLAKTLGERIELEALVDS